MRNDMDLLQRYVRNNDADAFAVLVDRHETFVFNVAMRITRNRADAEDVAQQCFLQLAKQAATITASVPGWLHKMAQWQSFQLLRECVSRRAREQTAADQLYVANGPPEWAQLDAVIDDAMAQLPDEQRTCLVLYYFERRTHAEVAQLLGTSRMTAQRRCHEALEELRIILNKNEIFMPSASLGALVLAHGNGVALPAALHGSLMKIALAGNKLMAGAAGKSAVAAAQKVFWIKVAASATGAAVIGSVAMVSYVHFSSVERIPADENNQARVQQVAAATQESTQMKAATTKTATNWMRAAVVAGGVLQATNLVMAQNAAQGGAVPGSSFRANVPAGNQASAANINGMTVSGGNGATTTWAPNAASQEAAITVVGTVSDTVKIKQNRVGQEVLVTGYWIRLATQPNARPEQYWTEVDLSAYVGQKVQVVGKVHMRFITAITSITPVS